MYSSGGGSGGGVVADGSRWWQRSGASSSGGSSSAFMAVADAVVAAVAAAGTRSTPSVRITGVHLGRARAMAAGVSDAASSAKTLTMRATLGPDEWQASLPDWTPAAHT